MEGLYLPGNKVANEKLTAEINNLRKRTNIITVLIIITLMLLCALAVIYFLNIPVTPYQDGSKSLFGAGKNTPNTNELNANLTKRLLAVEDQLRALQDKLVKVSSSTKVNTARAKAVDKRSESHAKKLNDSLTKNTDKLKQQIEKVEMNLNQNVQAVNMTASQSVGELGDGMKALKELVRQLQETDATIIDNTTTSLDRLKGEQDRINERVQETNASLMTEMASVQSMVRNLSNELGTYGDTLQDQRRETAQLHDEYVGIHNHIITIKANSANLSALDDVKEQLDQYHSHVTGNLTSQLTRLENKANQIALGTQQKNKAALANITADLRATQAKVEAVSMDVDELRTAVATEFTNVREEAAAEAANGETVMAALKGELLDVVQNMTAAFYPHLEELGKSLSGSNEALNQSIASDLQSTQNQVEAVSRDVAVLRNDLEANITGFKEKVAAHDTEDKENLATLKGELMDSVRNLNATVYPRMEMLGKSLSGDIEALNGTIAAKLTSLPTRLDALEDKLTGLANNVSTQLTQSNEFITNINTNDGDAPAVPQSSREEILAAIQPKLDEISQSVQAKINKLEADAYKNITIEVEKLNTKVVDLEFEVVALGGTEYGGEEEPEG